MLEERVSAIEQLQVSDNGITISLAIQCHQAVCYWLYHEAFNHPPSGNTFLQGSFSNTSDFLKGLARMGKPLHAGDLKANSIISAGHILIFTDKKLNAKHSCITLPDNKIGGYNQQSWFSTPGIPSDYSEHEYKDIGWNKKGVVKLSDNSDGYLMAVPENQALLFFRGNFKPD